MGWQIQWIVSRSFSAAFILGYILTVIDAVRRIGWGGLLIAFPIMTFAFYLFSDEADGWPAAFLWVGAIGYVLAETFLA